MGKRIIIIGAGPGGYIAAIRAAQLGAKVVVIEKDELGGTCLNKGCIPTKTIIAEVKKGNNLAFISKRKKTIVTQLVRGIEHLFHKRAIEVYKDKATLIDKNKVRLDSNQILEGDAIILAPGSLPFMPPTFPHDSKMVINSDEILELQEAPSSMIIVGGGIIGLEFACIFSILGTKVTVIEMRDQLLPFFDKEIARVLERELKKKKIEILLNNKVENIEILDNTVKIKVKEKELSADKALIAIGRKPNTDRLGLEKLGIETEGGFIKTNPYLQTSIPEIYAVGDSKGGSLLAHVAFMEGKLAAENIMGAKKVMDYSAVPNAIFTAPEVASVGITEEVARQKGIEFIVGKFPIHTLGRAQASGEIEGLAKLIAEKNSGIIKGFHLIGARATDLIGEATLAVKMKATVEDICNTLHPHPTFTEALWEAALAAHGEALYSN